MRFCTFGAVPLRSSTVGIIGLFGFVFFFHSPLASSKQSAQPTTAVPGVPGAAPAGQGARGGFGMRQRPVLDFNDNTGWTSMFNGHDLSEWDGDKHIWTVKDGAIYAESTCVLPTGTVYIDWNGNKNVGDFDMKFETLATDNVNGGVQYRSWIKGTPGKPTRPQRPTPPTGGGAAGAGRGAAGQGGQGGAARGGFFAGPPLGSPAASAADRGGRGGGPVVFAPACNGNSGPGPDPSVAVDPYYLDGPQFDYDAKGGVAGNFYEQDGRGTMATAGEIVVAEPNSQPIVVNRFADRATSQNWWKQNDWNQMMLVVRGHTYMQFINGHLTTVVVDDDPTRFQSAGMIGFEIESTGSVSMRNLYIRKF